MIDLDGLVLSQCMNVWAKPVTVTPNASQPLAAPYSARGVWDIHNVAIVTEEGGQLSNRTIKLGIRLSEFTMAPQQGDYITTLSSYLPMAYVQEQIDPTSSIDFVVDDVNPDGQGGACLILRRVIE